MVNKTEEEDKEVDSMAETVEYNEKIFLSELEASSVLLTIVYHSRQSKSITSRGLNCNILFHQVDH